MDKKALLVRMPVDLYSAAKSYAEKRGLSINAFVCIAVADYLDRNWGRPTNNAVVDVPNIGNSRPSGHQV
jgi:hypothetical protein